MLILYLSQWRLWDQNPSTAQYNGVPDGWGGMEYPSPKGSGGPPLEFL